jgi:serine/threonine-protein kinase
LAGRDDHRRDAKGIAFGEYRLIRRLGAGGMAEVFLAKRAGPGGFEKSLVIKRILPHLTGSEHLTELFLKEARLAALIDHPNLVHVSSFGRIDGQYYLAMEYVDGFTVTDFRSRVGTVSPGVACRIAIDLLGALHAIHTVKDDGGRPLELVHRDVSARNVMLTKDGGVKLLDFGIAVTREEEAPAAGTKKYMAPEQRSGGTIDHRADLFGVGVILYELITGEVPAGAKPDAIPEALWSVVRRLIAEAPGERPATAREAQAELEMFVGTRGREGTRAHIADLIDQLAPRSVPKRMLSRITQLTNLTRLTRVSEVSEAITPPSAAALWIGIGVVGIGIAAWTLWPRAPSTPPVIAASSTDPVTIVEPLEPMDPIEARTGTITEEDPVEDGAVGARARSKPKRAAAPGRLTIDTRPWTHVYLGKRRLGITPVVNVRLASGQHELLLHNPELGLKKKIRVTIRPGKTTRVQKTL